VASSGTYEWASHLSVIPAQAGTQSSCALDWIPDCAGTTCALDSRLRGNDLAWLIAGGSRGATPLCLSTNLRGGPR
jgi:hypothetical protein